MVVRFRVTKESAVEYARFTEDGDVRSFQTVSDTGPKQLQVIEYHCHECGYTFDEPIPGQKVNPL